MAFVHGEADCAYLAGIIDGEGCVRIAVKTRKGRRYHRPSLTVTNTDRRLIDYLALEWGAVVYDLKPARPERDKPQFSASWYGQAMIDILQETIPYLLLKREQALLAVGVQRTICSLRNGQYRPISDAVMEYREDCFQRVRILNRKGIAA